MLSAGDRELLGVALVSALAVEQSARAYHYCSVVDWQEKYIVLPMEIQSNREGR
jgi:hypothetical protein